MIPPAPPVEDLARVFNTALVATRTPEVRRDISTELCQLMETPAFRAILNAIRQHARLHALSDRQAAEQVIQAFRRADQIWAEYVFQEGVEQLRSQNC